MYNHTSGRGAPSAGALFCMVAVLIVLGAGGQAAAQSTSSSANRGAGSGFGDALSARITEVSEKAVVAKEEELVLDYEAWVSGNYNRNEFADSGSSLDQDLYIATLAGGVRIDKRYIIGGALAYGLSEEDTFQLSSGTAGDGETDAYVGAFYGGFLVTENILLDVLALRLFLDHEEEQFQNGVFQSRLRRDTHAWAINFGATYSDVVDAVDYGVKLDYKWSRFDSDAFTDSAGNSTLGEVDVERKLTLTVDAGYTIEKWHPTVMVGYEHNFDPVRDVATNEETDDDGWLLGAGVDYALTDRYLLSLQGTALLGNDNLDSYESILSLKASF